MPAKILIVEDERNVALATQYFLESEGYDVCGIAGTGEKALELTRETSPDLILMDINLGEGMDGIATSRSIRQEHSVPIVFLSAYSDEATLRRAGATTPFSYLVKPIQERQLKPVIEMAIYHHKAEREREELLTRLQHALTEVERLRHFLPVCAWCRKVRNDEGYYQDLIDYLSETFGTKATHGICDDCARKLLHSEEDKMDSP